MIGIVLLLLSVVLYGNKRYRWFSYLIYIGFLSQGFNLYNNKVTSPFQCDDLALFYTIFVLLVRCIKGNLRPISFLGIRKIFVVFLVFLLLSAFFSYIHYGFSLIQIVTASRRYFLVTSILVLYQIKYEDISKIINALFIITVFTSVLYCLQVISGVALMPTEREEYEVISSVGIVRFGNIPVFLGFFLIMVFANPDFIKKHLNLYRVLFIACLVLTLGRSFIITSIAAILFAMLSVDKKHRGKSVIILFLALSPVMGILTSRMSSGGTFSDISSVINGDFDEDYSKSQSEGNLTYRIAWVYERIAYLIERPLSEQFFGMGFINDNQIESTMLYNFNITIRMGSQTFQLYTPDIAYGTMVAYLGFGGTLIYMLFLYKILTAYWRWRKSDRLALVAFFSLLFLIINSFTGNFIAKPGSLAIYYLLLNYIYKRRCKLNLMVQK